MRLIPGKTKVKIQLFRGITLGDIIVGAVTLALVALAYLSTFALRYILAGVFLVIGVILLLRLDGLPIYKLVISLLRYMAYPKRYRRKHTDKEIVPVEDSSGDTDNAEMPDLYSDTRTEVDNTVRRKSFSDRQNERKKYREESKLLKSKKLTEEEKNAIWKERAERSAAKKRSKNEKKAASPKKTVNMEEIIPFTGIKDGMIEYNGKYYGSIIEIDPVEFRFFSEYRRNASIENCFGKIIRSLRISYSANIIKIDRPIMYDSFLEKEYDKLDELKRSYEKGFLTEEELKSRVEIQYDRIRAMRDICYDNKIIQPFYYLAIYNIDKKQLNVDTDSALSTLQQAELTVHRLTTDKELAVFLKYTNYLDFDEREIEKIDPKDYISWAMPETLSFTSKEANINNVVTHHMRVIDYPSGVGDAWLAGVMSIPATKVVIKFRPMDRTKSVHAIDMSLQELRSNLNSASLDSKKIELESHIETLSQLLVTLKQDNEALLTVNIYISMYDAVKSALVDGDERKTSLAVIADMKKTVRRNWQETGMRLNGLDFSQTEAFIGSQISACDPMVKDGRPMPSNTIAAMYPWIYARVSDEGGIRLGQQDGVPVFIDFFRRDSERVNSNMVIIGKSGSGKSYGTKSLLTNMASEDAKIFILDPENEYTELAHTLHGKIINVGNAKFGRLNPFHVITTLDDSEDGESKSGDSFSAHLQFLEEFFKQILPDLEKNAMEHLNSLVERLYDNFNISIETDLSKLSPEDYPIFDDLYDLVLEDFQRSNNEYVRSMLQTLMNHVSKFATGGRNANIWNGPSSITTDENFSVFNFQSLLSNRNSVISNAQMLLVLKYIDNEIIKNRDYNRKYGLNRKIVVVIDEAHVFIDTKYPIALDFMFQLAKRIRKYNGMLIVITQNIKDFVGSEDIARKSTAIINASQYSFIFGLAPNDITDLCKLYEKAGGINEIEQDQILTAPRGMAFTIMSPTSRSSFMIEVPQTMVDMFEQPDYQTHYFNGEDGAQVWEDFVAESRSEHEENTGNTISGYVYDDEKEEKPAGTVFFSEIGLDEAEELNTEIEKNISERGKRGRKPMPKVSAQQSTVSFTEVDAVPEANTEEKTVSNVAQSEVQSGSVQAAVDVVKLIDSLRDELRREMNMQFSVMKQTASAVPDTVPQSSSAAEKPAPVPQTEDIGISASQSVAKPEPAKTEPAKTEPAKETSTKLPDAQKPETAAPEKTEKSAAPKYDFKAMLNRQLQNYSNMTLEERMRKTEVETKTISISDLDEYIKKSRKKGSN